MCWFMVTFECKVLPEVQGGYPFAPFKLAVFTTDARKASQAAVITPGCCPDTILTRGVTDAHLKLLCEYTTARRVY